MVLRLTVLLCDSTTAFSSKYINKKTDKHYERSHMQLVNLEPGLSTYEM